MNLDTVKRSMREMRTIKKLTIAVRVCSTLGAAHVVRSHSRALPHAQSGSWQDEAEEDTEKIMMEQFLLRAAGPPPRFSPIISALAMRCARRGDEGPGSNAPLRALRPRRAVPGRHGNHLI